MRAALSVDELDVERAADCSSAGRCPLTRNARSRRDIDAVAHQVAIALLDDIAEMDADADFDVALRRQAGVALDHAVLDLDGAANRIDDASELDENAIARPFDDAVVMQRDGGVDEVAAERAQPRKRPLLV